MSTYNNVCMTCVKHENRIWVGRVSAAGVGVSWKARENVREMSKILHFLERVVTCWKHVCWNLKKKTWNDIIDNVNVDRFFNHVCVQLVPRVELLLSALLLNVCVCVCVCACVCVCMLLYWLFYVSASCAYCVSLFYRLTSRVSFLQHPTVYWTVM